MLHLFRRKSDNAWIESDRRERAKLILTALVLVGAAAGGIGLVIHSLASH